MEISEKTNKKLLFYYLRISGTLLVISTLIAVILAAVNMITADKIAANKRMEIENAISEIFQNTDSVEKIQIETAFPVSEIYKASSGGNTVGYCVYVTPSGFGGKIEMIVGTDTVGTILDVKIVSLSETPGLGTNVNDSEYLSSYAGKSGNLKLHTDIDAVAGASISSKAVLTGVNAALDVINSLNTEAATDGK